jgi:hypothetical protein
MFLISNPCEASVTGSEPSPNRDSSMDSRFKLFYLSLKIISCKWTLTIPNWPRVLNHLFNEFEDGIPSRQQATIGTKSIPQSSLRSPSHRLRI